VLAGGGKELWAGYRNSQGLHGMMCGAIGAEVFAHSHKKIQKLADLKGFKYRTAGANTQVMRALGAAPTLVPGPEVFTLLERKGVDGAEYLDPYGNYSLGFAKIAKYVILPGIHAPGALYELLMKKSLWDSFPKDIQQKMEMVCDSVLINSYAVTLVNNVKAMKAIAASKTNEIVTLDKEVQDAIRAGGRAWAAEKTASEAKKGNMWMGKLAESYYAFQDDWKGNSAYQVLDAASK
jgi:TRAP-type mannitol/chloroaromatic compound transport system substrate-binding protein